MENTTTTPTHEPYTWVYRLRGPLTVLPCIAILIMNRWESENHLALWSIGLTLFAAGFLVRIWAQMHLHYRLQVKKILTLTGPYRFVRNPIYIANISILLALTVLSELLWFLPLMLIWCCVLYTFVVRREEAHLSNKYGEPYIEFLRTVPRWMPRLPHSDPTNEDVRKFLKPSIVAELHCFLWIVPFALKEIFSTYV